MITPDELKSCIRTMQNTSEIARVYVDAETVAACWCQFAFEQMSYGGLVPRPDEVPIYRGVRVLPRRKP